MRVLLAEDNSTSRHALETHLTQWGYEVVSTADGDENYWQQVETYLGEHADVKFSHGICPDCYDRVRREFDDGLPTTE